MFVTIFPYQEISFKRTVPKIHEVGYKFYT